MVVSLFSIFTNAWGPKIFQLNPSSWQQRWSIWDVSVSWALQSLSTWQTLISVWWFLLNRKHPIFPTATDTNITDQLFHTCKAGRFGLFKKKKRHPGNCLRFFLGWFLSCCFFCYILNPLFVCIDYTGETHHHFASTKEAEAVRSEGWEGWLVIWLYSYTTRRKGLDSQVATMSFVQPKGAFF